MVNRGERLAGLEEATVFDDGEVVAFTVKTTTGDTLRVNCPLVEVGDIFSYLGQLAKFAGEARNVPIPPFPSGYNDLAPIPAQTIGFQAGTTPQETLLIIRLSGFDMAFAFESSALVALADDIRRIALTLSAGGEKPQ